jgi:PIN domain nuclease of toxin-antitoxin system
MRLLLDTHLLVWTLGEPDRLSTQVRRTLQDTDNSAVDCSGDRRFDAVVYR